MILAFGLLHFPRKLSVLDQLNSKKVFYKVPHIRDYDGLQVAIVGAGDSALDAALMVQERNGQVDLLSRSEPIGKAQMLQHIQNSGGIVHTKTKISAAKFSGDQIALTLNDGSILNCDLVIVQIGFLAAEETFDRLDV